MDNKKSINTHSYQKRSEVKSKHSVLSDCTTPWIISPWNSPVEYYFNSIYLLQMKKYVTTEYFHDSLKTSVLSYNLMKY